MMRFRPKPWHLGSAALLVVLLAHDGTAKAQSAPSKLHAFRLYAGLLQGKYGERTKNEAQERTGEQSGIGLSGTHFQVAGVYKDFELELDQRAFTPQDVEYWASRTETAFNFSYYWPRFKWVAPSVGYVTTTQVGDDSEADAPPAFIDKNTALAFGVRTSFEPFAIKKVHTAIVMGRVSYLTSLEAKSNFGTDMYAGLGYVYAMTRMRIGLTGGYLQNFFNGTKADEDVAGKFLHVRHTYTATMFGLYLQY